MAEKKYKTEQKRKQDTGIEVRAFFCIGGGSYRRFPLHCSTNL